MELNIMNIKKLNLTLIILSTLLVITFSSLAQAVLSDSVGNLKTCGEDDNTAACDGVCKTNDSGHIEIGTLGLPVDADTTTSYRDSCNMIPDFYRVTLYSGGLCTADPYSASGTTVDYTTNCDLFFSDASGKVITLTHDGNGAATASPSLTDSGVNLGIKTYTHAYMLMSNHLQIKHSTTFDFTGTSTASKMQGGGASAQSEGLVCWTTDSTSTFSNLDGTTGENHGTRTLRVGDGTYQESSTQCGDTLGVTHAYATEIIESFGEASGNWGDSAVTPRMAYSASPLDIGGTKAAILLQDDLTTVATTMENGVVMLYAVALTTPLAITEDTTTFNIGFGLSGSVSVDFTTKDGSDELYITKHGADPVDIKFTAE
ncbi:hypothetical protein N9T64_00575 [Pelagibacteraceae bacterium]|nr:hypothetical protein [Pelagibacteraceae bacterium]